MSALTEAVSRYGAVGVGLALGTAAKWGLALGDGKRPTWRDALADILLLGLLGLLAVTISDWAGLTGNAKVLAGAMTAVSSDRLVRLIRKRFEDRIMAEVDTHIRDMPAPKPPSEAAAHFIGGPLPAPHPELDELVKRIDEASTPEADGTLPPKP